jgi:hypothetical protein
MADDPTDDPFVRLGKPDAVFGPSPGQTFAGVLVGVGLATVGFAVAATGDGFGTGNRLAFAAFGAAGVGLAVWVWRLRRWRLAVCPGGLVQLRAGGVEELRWADMTEVIDTRMHALGGEQTVRVTAVGRAAKLVVNPVNSRARRRLFRVVLEAAARNGVPVRVEWEESD